MDIEFKVGDVIRFEYKEKFKKPLEILITHIPYTKKYESIKVTHKFLLKHEDCVIACGIDKNGNTYTLTGNWFTIPDNEGIFYVIGHCKRLNKIFFDLKNIHENRMLPDTRGKVIHIRNVF